MTKKIKLGKGLFSFFGALKDDKKYYEIIKYLKERWHSWSKKYV